MSEKKIDAYTVYASTDYVDEKIANVNSIKDWNVNDENDPAYIKNRTHWNERSWTVLEETTFTIDYLYNDVHQYVLPTPEDDTLTIGATYIVNWNGDEYTVTAYKYKYNDNLICLGNESLSSTENDTGEPFLIELNINRFDGRETEFRLHTKDTEGTISIFKPEIIHKLDSKYLPESIVTKDYVDQKIAEINIETPTEYESIILKSSVSGSTKKFRLTIDDDGVLSAEEVVL